MSWLSTSQWFSPSIILTSTILLNHSWKLWEKIPLTQHVNWLLIDISWILIIIPYLFIQGSYEKKKMPSTEASSHVISDLEVDTTYGIMVKHETGDGRVSEYSEMQFVKPSNSGNVNMLKLGNGFMLINHTRNRSYISERYNIMW